MSRCLPTVLVVLGLAVSARAQQVLAPSASSSSIPPLLKAKPGDIPNVTATQAPLQDQFSLRKLLAKVIPGLSPTSSLVVSPGPAPTGGTPSFNILSGLQSLNPFSTQSPLPQYVPPPSTGPINPLPPTTALPVPQANPFMPLPPTTSLPLPQATPFKPLPPVMKPVR